VDSGRITFPFGALSISQAYVSFSGNNPQGPDVLITASGRNYRYDLQLDITGPAARANVVFSSSPPLGSEEILLMLTAGEVPRNDYSFSTSARAGRLITFLGTDLLNRFMGSGQGVERLIIRTGENISDDGKLTYSVEYRLTDRWSIIGEYDRFNAFNADLKWKLFSR
jgi:translocation and assembly module TamB